MKTIWNIFSVLAVLNVLALLGGAGWLAATDRLSKDRVRAVKEAFVRTNAQEAADKAAAEAAAQVKEAQAVQAKKMAEPPQSAAEKIAGQETQDEQEYQARLRKMQDLESLQSSVLTQLAQLESREKKLEAEKKAIALERKKFLESDGDKQFQAALATLEGQKAKDAKQMLRAMLEQRQTDQVVTYLAKMEEGKRAKVMAEFVKDDPALAADLLERLRLRGVSGAVVAQQDSVTQGPGNDPASTSPARGGPRGAAGAGQGTSR